MAKHLVAVAVIAFYFVAVARARTTADFPDTDDTDRRIPDPFAHSGSKATILLPSQKPDSSLETVSSAAAAATAAKSKLSGEEPGDDAAVKKTVTSVPLTMLNFRPINRRFQRVNARRFWYPFPLRHHHHEHPHRHHRFMPMTTRISASRRDLPYGEDIFVGRGGPAFPYRRPNHNLRRRFRKAEVEWLFHGKGRESEERKDGGIMKSIRKFLNQF